MDKPASRAGRIVSTVVWLFFVAVGIGFAVGFGSFIWKDARTWLWQETPCVIQSSKVITESRSLKHRFAVSYSYEHAGRSHTSVQYRRGYHASDDYAEAQRLVDRFRADSQAVCYVDPDRPQNAVLERSSFWQALFLLIPLVFVVSSLGAIWYIWRPDRASASPAGQAVHTSISEKAKTPRTLVGVIVLVLLFSVGMAIPFTVLPAVRLVRAQSWQQVPCTIISSRVREHDSDDGSTYSADILYEYMVEGRPYRSNRYGAFSGSSSGYAGYQAVVNRYRPGSRAVCYVNPADPNEAMLSRQWQWPMLFGLIPLLLTAGIIVGVRVTRRARRRREEAVIVLTARSLGRRTPLIAPQSPFGAISAAPAPLVLRPRTPPLAKLFGALLFVAIWDGIVSIFLVEMVSGWRNGRPDLCLTVFLIPFVLVGLGAIAMVVYCMLALLNPRVRVTIAPGTPRLGDTLDVRWAFSGRHGRVSRLQVHLEGREEAQYRRGTSTYTDRNVFLRIALADVTRPSEIASGRRNLQIPLDTMHSFEASNNKIIWGIAVHGEIAKWPDVKEEFIVQVLPLPAEGIAAPDAEVTA